MVQMNKLQSADPYLISYRIYLFICLFVFEKYPLGSGSVFPVVVDVKYELA